MRDAEAVADVVVTTIKAALAPIQARLAVLEAKEPRDGRDGLPGRDGAHGAAGDKGMDGRDGQDGLGFDDLSVVHDGERTFTVKFARGTTVKDAGTFTVKGLQIYRGVFQAGHHYDHGDVTTWAGSTWHCNETTTTKPGDGSKAWTLMVKRGANGKDGVT